jgi:ElaB/YqjD/DUF883 family membrane-anchored ribosome-binding protein
MPAPSDVECLDALVEASGAEDQAQRLPSSSRVWKVAATVAGIGMMACGGVLLFAPAPPQPRAKVADTMHPLGLEAVDRSLTSKGDDKGLGDHIKDLGDSVNEGIDSVKDTVDSIGDKIEDHVDSIGDHIEKGKDKVNDITDAIGEGIDNVTGHIKSIGDKIEDHVDSIGDKVGGIVNATNSTFHGAVSNATDKLEDKVGDTIDSVGDTVDSVKDKTSEAVDGVVDSAQGLGESAGIASEDSDESEDADGDDEAADDADGDCIQAGFGNCKDDGAKCCDGLTCDTESQGNEYYGLCEETKSSSE